jgi:hypothetical protein
MQFHYKLFLGKKKKNRKQDPRYVLFLLTFASPDLIRIPFIYF